MSHLFEPLTIKNLTLRNRIVMAPMCMYSADEVGNPTPFHLNHYETRAIGGTSLIILEATAVQPRGRISANDLGIWSDAHIEGLEKIVQGIHRHGALAGIQLAHAGRKCTVLSEDVFAPSAIPFDENDAQLKTPREMTEADINEVIDAFAKGAERALKAGFDVIEIHAAHGYLINEFLSPLTNQRTDHYGKQPELLLGNILKAIQSKWPVEKPIFVRVSAEDYVSGGNTSESISHLINKVKDLGIDVVNVSSGGVVPAGIKTYDGYQTKFAETIKQLTELPVMSGGRIKTAEMAEEMIRNNRADLVFLGRQLLIDPYFPLHAATTLKQEIDYAPVQYERWKTSR